MGTWDSGLGDMGLGDVGRWGRGDVGRWGRGDVGTWGRGDVGTWGRWTRGHAGTRGRDKQTTPNICAEFVEYNFRWSPESHFSSRCFSASMVRPDIFACLFDRENSGYRIVSTQGVLKHPCLILAKKE